MPDPCCNADRGGLPMNLTIARGRIISERPAFSPRLITPMNPAAIAGWTSFFETSDLASSLRVGVSGDAPEEDTRGRVQVDRRFHRNRPATGKSGGEGSRTPVHEAFSETFYMFRRSLISESCCEPSRHRLLSVHEIDSLPTAVAPAGN